MATIQVRDIPEDTYETIRRRARAAGQSIQAYMRDQVVDLASRMTSSETWRLVEGSLAGAEPGPSREDVLAALDATRRG